MTVRHPAGAAERRSYEVAFLVEQVVGRGPPGMDGHDDRRLKPAGETGV